MNKDEIIGISQNTLIEELKRENESLIELIANVRELGIGSNEGQSTFDAVHNRLHSYMDKIQSSLYPMLKSVNSSDSSIVEYMDGFETLRPDILARAEKVYGMYSSGQIDVEFLSEMVNFFKSMEQRMIQDKKLLQSTSQNLFPAPR